jgi:hypothetical protein
VPIGHHFDREPDGIAAEGAMGKVIQFIFFGLDKAFMIATRYSCNAMAAGRGTCSPAERRAVNRNSRVAELLPLPQPPGRGREGGGGAQDR